MQTPKQHPCPNLCLFIAETVAGIHLAAKNVNGAPVFSTDAADITLKTVCIKVFLNHVWRDLILCRDPYIQGHFDKIKIEVAFESPQCLIWKMGSIIRLIIANPDYHAKNCAWDTPEENGPADYHDRLKAMMVDWYYDLLINMKETKLLARAHECTGPKYDEIKTTEDPDDLFFKDVPTHWIESVPNAS